MARKLNLQQLKSTQILTHEGASAYDYRDKHPLIHLVFTMGSALFTGGFYHRQEQEVRKFASALLAAYRHEPRFPWQYGAWMRDPVGGKGNRIQGSLVPALLDALTDPSKHTEQYTALCLKHRADDPIAFLQHYAQLGLGAPSRQARFGLARALTHFDEYQLMKYARSKQDLRLCDVIYLVKDELKALGDAAQLVLEVGKYLHAPTRKRKQLVRSLPLTKARRHLFRRRKHEVTDPALPQWVAEARVTWEQVFGHFGTSCKELEGAQKARAESRNNILWRAMLDVPGLIPDTALMRNIRNLHEAGFRDNALCAIAEKRSFRKLWPHQVYAAFQAIPERKQVWETIFRHMTKKLPPGRHLGIGDASGSMSIRVGGLRSSIRAMDVAFCLVALMSETSQIGASFSDNSWFGWSTTNYLSIAERRAQESLLDFSTRYDIRAGMGGTQVFGAIIELIVWLKEHDHIAPPDCLWFFSDMQFHPAEGALQMVPEPLLTKARKLGLGKSAPPLELALQLYRKLFGHVDVVLWNLAAYAPVPVPAEIPGVLLVSGFDTNTFSLVQQWREDPDASTQQLAQNQEVILDKIRSY